MKKILVSALSLGLLVVPGAAAQTLGPDTILVAPAFFSDPNHWPFFGTEGNGVYFSPVAVQDTDPRTGQLATFLYVMGGQSDSAPLRPGYVNCHADEVILFVYPAGQETTPWNQLSSSWRNNANNVVRVSDCPPSGPPNRSPGQPIKASNGDGFITFGISDSADFWEVRLARSTGLGKWRDFSQSWTLIQTAPSRRCSADNKRPDGTACNHATDNLELADVHLVQTGTAFGWLVFKGFFRFGVGGADHLPSSGMIQVIYNPFTFQRTVWVLSPTGFVQLPSNGSISFNPADVTPAGQPANAYGEVLSVWYNPVQQRHEMWRILHRQRSTLSPKPPLPPSCNGTVTYEYSVNRTPWTSEAAYHVVDLENWVVGPLKTLTKGAGARPIPADYSVGYTGAGLLRTAAGRTLLYTAHRDRNICTDVWSVGQAEAMFQGLYVVASDITY
jgi:hypothetical protein